MKLTVGCFLLSISILAAQTVRVSSSSAAPGDEARIAVSLESPPDQEPVTVQMDIEVPMSVFSIEGPPEAGEAATASGKSASCSGHWEKAPQLYTYRCILAGGVGRISDGDILVAKGKVPAGAKPGRNTIRVHGVLAVDAKANSIPLKPASGALSVTRK